VTKIKKTRGPSWTVAEDQRVRLMRSEGKSIRAIGAALGRGKSSVHARIVAMNWDGSIDQLTMDMGQFDAD